MVLISGMLLIAPILTGFTNQPYRFVPLVVFFAIGGRSITHKETKLRGIVHKTTLTKVHMESNVSPDSTGYLSCASLARTIFLPWHIWGQVHNGVDSSHIFFSCGSVANIQTTARSLVNIILPDLSR